MRARSGKLVTLLAMSLALTGCLNEEDKDESGSGLKEALNNPPVLAGVPPTSAMAGEPYGFQPAAADPDGQAITFSIRNKPRWAAFDEGTGRLSGTPTMDDLGSYPGVAIAASDGIATSELEEFAITVKAPPGSGGSNTTPTIAGTPSALAYVGSEYRFTPAAVDADGDALKFAVTGKPSWLSFDEASGTLSGTPGNEHLGVHEQIVVSVTDGSEYAFLPMFEIAVEPAQSNPGGNQPPVIAGSPPTNVAIGQSYAFRPTASDPDGQRLSFSIANRPAWASFNASTGELSGTPGTTDIGMYSGVVISVSDGTATATLAAFAVSVYDPANAPPVIEGAPATKVDIGVVYIFQPEAYDPDGDPITFIASNKPRWMSFDTKTGKLSGVTDQSIAGTYDDIKIMASDGKAISALPAFSLKVGVVETSPPPPPPPTEPPSPSENRAPTIGGTPAASVEEGEAYNFQPRASDPDGDTLTFAVANAPGWAVFNAATGRLSGTPPQGSAGTYSGIGISVSDGEAVTALPPFTVTVRTPSNTPPTISGSPATTIQAGHAYNFQPRAADPDSQTLRFGIANKPAWASFDDATGQLSGTPTDAQVGTYTNIVVSVSDGVSSATLPPFSITVTGTATGTAELSWTAPTLNDDGSALTNLAGYKVRYGQSAGNLDQGLDVPGAGTTAIVINDLGTGTWYFTVASYTNTGVQSVPAGPVYKTIQ